MYLKVHDVVRIRRTNGKYQLARINSVTNGKVFVEFEDQNLIYLRGPMKPEDCCLIKSYSVTDWCKKKLKQTLLLLLKIFRIKSKYIFCFLLTALFLNGVYFNYCLIEEKQKDNNRSFFVKFLPPLFPTFYEPASIWKATLNTFSDIPRAFIKLFGFLIGDFSEAVFSNFGELEKVITTYAFSICIIKLLARQFL
jgi:hypothetical protein